MYKKNDNSRTRNALLPLIGYLILNLADQLFSFACPILFYEVTKTALASSTFTAIDFLPTTIFGFFIGVFLDRFSRRILIFFGLIVQSIFALLIPISVFHNIPLIIIYILTFIMSTAELVSTTGIETIVPSISGKENLTKITGIMGFINSVLRMIGPGIAGLLLANFGYKLGFLTASVLFLSVGLIIIIMPNQYLENKKIEKNIKSKVTYFDSLKSGFYYVFKDKILRPITFSFLFANLGFGLVVPVLIYTLKSDFLASDNMIGLFFSFAAVGALITNLGYIKFCKKISLGIQLIATGIVILLGFLTMMFTSNIYIFAIAYLFVSCGSVWAQSNFYYVNQARTCDDYRGRVTTTTKTMSRIFGPVMAVVGGFFTDYVGIKSIFALACVFMVLSIGCTVGSGLCKINKVEEKNY